MRARSVTLALAVSLALPLLNCHGPSAAVERPETIVSKRITVYDQDTYRRLADLWRQYNNAFPSEEAYGNWMKAARYADLPDYLPLLAKGVRQYPGNPVLLYLDGIRTAGSPDARERIAQLERAARLDPAFTDPVFALVVDYLASGRGAEMDAMLQRLLVQGAIPDVVLDYSFNMLATLGPQAILITNGDNDTFPGWALARIERYRSDVLIVNRSLLNSEWYPPALIQGGAPSFLADGELAAIRAACDAQARQENGLGASDKGYSEALILRLVDAARRARRPVYFALTMPTPPALRALRDAGRCHGLATLVTPAPADGVPDAAQMLQVWVSDFRTGGLDSWRLKHAPPADAGRMLAANYAAGLAALVAANPPVSESLKGQAWEWYLRHVDGLLSVEDRQRHSAAWSRWSDLPAVRAWLQHQSEEFRAWSQQQSAR